MGTVQFENVCKRFGDVSIVENLNLTVADGEFMVLLGPSGCGKSTTLRMIAGLETMSEGTISIDGAVMNNVTAKDRDIAMVFQSYALYPHMSVEGNLAFGLKRRSMSKAEIAKRVAAAASTLGLDSLLHRKPHALSGGQRQRVALGRAIVREPKVFLFDEPLSNLDAALRVGMRSELIDLHRRLGSTMIYVTHDQVEAMTMGSRICIMHDGRIMQVGSPLDVYRNPNSVFVAQFLGSPPMNLLTVALDRPAGRAVVAGQASFDIPDSIFRRCGVRNDVTLGIRPEDFRAVSAASGMDTVCMSARVLRIEHLGAEMLVTCHLLNQKTTVVARLDPRFDINADAGITLEVDAPKIQCFDAQSGAAISQQ